MKLYYLSITIIIGIIAGGFLVGYGTNSNNSETLTSEKLIKNGSPIMGNIDAVSYTHLTLPTTPYV